MMTEFQFMMSWVSENIRFFLFQLKTAGNPWLDETDNRLTIEIEWQCTYLLLHPTYHPYDDVYRKHIAQMRCGVSYVFVFETHLTHF